jgi:alkylated DNA repair dioxygenase AlkB
MAGQPDVPLATSDSTTTTSRAVPRQESPCLPGLARVRERAAQLAQVEPEELVEILVQKYPPGSTINWHRDAPAFGTVVGVSRQRVSLRFQRGKQRALGPALGGFLL